MNKPAIPIIVATCLLAGFMVGANLAPRVLADQAVRHAADEALVPVIQSSIHQAADEEGHKIAREVSQTVPAHAVRRHKAATASRTGLDRQPTMVWREAFSITLPAGCVVDPSPSIADSEHRFSVNVPGHGLIYIIVNDSNRLADATYDSLISNVRAKVGEPEDAAPDIFNPMQTARASGVRGRIDGQEFLYQFAQIERPSAGIVILTEYPHGDSWETERLIREALATFRLHQ